MKLRLYIFLLLFCLLNHVQAEVSYSFNTLDLNDGLSQNSVVSIAQDSTGFLWFATQDGLNKYDGYRFTYYERYFWDVTNEQEVKMGQLFVDAEGLLWIISESGQLEYYDRKKDELKASAFKGSSDVRHFFQDDNGHYYLSNAAGLFLFKDKEDDGRKILDKTIIANSSRAGKTYLLAEDNVYVIENDTVQKIDVRNINDGAPTSIFTAIHQNRAGDVFLGTFSQGLFRLNKDRNIFEPTYNDLTYISILSLLSDKEGRLWIGSYGDGVYLADLDRSEFANFQTDKNDPRSIAYNDILCMMQDHCGNIWFGTDGAGLSFYDENLNKFKGYSQGQVPADVHVDVVRALQVDSKDNLWIGTSGYGLTRLKESIVKDEWQTYTSANSALSNDRVMSIENAENNNLWVGTQSGGLNLYLEKQDRFLNISGSLAQDITVWDIHKDSEERIWLGTQKSGLIEIDVNTYETIHQLTSNKSLGLHSDNIRCIVNAKDKNKLWIGTEDEGLFLFDKTKLSFKKISKLKEIEKIKCLYLDNTGMLWIGTNGSGLVSYNTENESSQIYSKDEGLPNNVIYGILPDRNSNLWLSSNRGICKFPLPQFNKDKNEIIVFDNYDGLQSFEFNTGAYTRSTSGELYFGGVNGFNWFNPDDLKTNKSIPKAMLTEIAVNNVARIVELSKEGTLELNANETNISLGFASNNYSLPERNMFKYQLIGYDEEEIQTDGRNFVQYTNLSHGDYKFSVRASNYDNVWSKQNLILPIHIATPWYKTLLAKIIYLLLLATALYTVYAFLKRRWALQSELQLQTSQTEHLKEMSQFKNQLYANITHDFRTPLTVIKGMAEDIEDVPLAQEMISENANHLLTLVNQILDLSKLEEGFLELEMEQIEVISYISYLTESMMHQAERNQINLEFESAVDSLWMDVDVNKFKEIIFNLISNAIKFTNKGGSVSVSCSTKEGSLLVNVKDTGIGISSKNLPYIFDRFYQVENEDNISMVGSGIGLAFVSQLITLMSGNISVESEEHIGSSFCIELPIKNELPKRYLDLKEVQTYQRALVDSEIYESSEDLDKPRILIVEDSADVSTYLHSFLKSKYVVEFAENGREGLENALAEIPDLVISDVMMPKMNGYEFCNALKQNEITEHIPIILLTAKVEQSDRISGLKKGADAYLTKPFDKEELLTRIHQLLLLREKLKKSYKDRPDKIVESVDPFLVKVNELLALHYGEEAFKTSELCNALFYSKMQVHRKLKALTGLSTSSYLREYRLNKSAEQLLDPNVNVSDVAFASGFSSVQYFSRLFKEKYGQSPSQYVEERTRLK